MLATFPCDGSTPSQTSPSSTMSLTSTVTTPVQVDHVLRSTAASSSVHSSTSQAPVIRETSVQPNPTSCTHASKSATPITLIHTSNANVTLSTSAPPRVEQIPWLLIGCVTAAVVAIILITTFTVFCFLKRGGKRHNQTETVMDEHFYDCVSYGVSAQISNHPKVVTDDHVHDSYAPIETVMNEAYATNEWNSIEINQNVAYDVYARIMTATDSQLYDNI